LCDKIAESGGQPVIPPKRDRTFKRPYDDAIYKERNIIERFFNKLKQFRRVATRYDKLLENFIGFVKLAAIAICLKQLNRHHDLVQFAEIAASHSKMKFRWNGNSTSRRTVPGLPEAVSFESRRHGGLLCHGIVAFLGFVWRDVADGLQQPAIVEPVHPLQRRELDSLE
jgi:Transposase DDE domain